MRSNIRKRMLSGTLLLAPFVVTLLVIQWLFKWTTSFLRPAIRGILSRSRGFTRLAGSADLFSLCIWITAIVILLLLFILSEYSGTLWSQTAYIGRRKASVENRWQEQSMRQQSRLWMPYPCPAGRLSNRSCWWSFPVRASGRSVFTGYIDDSAVKDSASIYTYYSDPPRDSLRLFPSTR